MNLEGEDFWGNKARELRTLLAQRWRDCRFANVRDLPPFQDVMANPSLEALRDLERKLGLRAVGKRVSRKQDDRSLDDSQGTAGIAEHIKQWYY